jgi:hypothetical protein
MTANNQYFATYKKFSTPVYISLADKGTILTYVSGRVNSEMLVKGKWCPGYLEDMRYVPDVGRHLFSVHSATEHGASVVIKRWQVMFHRDDQLVATGEWTLYTYILRMSVVVQRNPAEVNVGTASHHVLEVQNGGTLT